MANNVKIIDLDLAFVKDYLRIDHTDDDNLLTTMLISAQSFIQSYLNKKFADMTLAGEEIPDEFTIACLAIISHWYEKRAVQGDKDTGKELAYIFSGLLDMHRNWSSEVVPV